MPSKRTYLFEHPFFSIRLLRLTDLLWIVHLLSLFYRNLEKFSSRLQHRGYFMTSNKKDRSYDNKPMMKRTLCTTIKQKSPLLLYYVDMD